MKSEVIFHTRTCLLTTFSTVDRLRGTMVELSMYLLSWPVYTTRPKQQRINKNNQQQTQSKRLNGTRHTLPLTIHNFILSPLLFPQ